MTHWKKFITAGLAVLGTAALIAGCSGNAGSSHSAGSLQSAPEKAFVIGLDDNFPPFGFHDKQGNLVGFDVDMAKEAARRMGVKAEFKPIDWSAKEAELKGHKIDAIWSGLSITPQREENMLFSRPYQNARQIILVKEDSPIRSKSDLAGKTVGTQEGSTGLAAINKDTDMKAQLKDLKLYSDNVSGFMDLKIGRIDAMVVAEVVALYYNHQNQAGFRVVDGGYDFVPTGVGIAKDNQALKDQLDKALESMHEDGTASEISKKWFGEDITK